MLLFNQQAMENNCVRAIDVTHDNDDDDVVVVVSSGCGTIYIYEEGPWPKIRDKTPARF